MGHPITTRTAARTAVVAGYLGVLALAGGPGWLAALLALVLVGVWAAPFLLVTNRRPAGAGPVLPVAEPREAGPSS